MYILESTGQILSTFVLCLVLIGIAIYSNYKPQVPSGFVYIEKIDPSIKQQLRYATKQNFAGNVIPGYKATSRAILTVEAAVALHNAQKEFLQHGYSIVLYDTYRPQSSVDYFFRWVGGENQDMKKLYFPYIEKADIPKGYLARKSGHTRGSTVDMSIISVKNKLKAIEDIIISERTLKNGQTISYFDDGTVDMGSSFDLFHEASFFQTDLINEEAQKNRDFLEKIMRKHGFEVYSKEWWHFTLQNEPFANKYFNFIF